MKTTLIAVSGMSPAILTETVWALAHETPLVVPDEVVVITTSRGVCDIEELLLTPLDVWGGETVWSCLRRDIFALAKLPQKSARLQLATRVIELPDAATGVKRKASDLRSREDNDSAADFIVQVLAPYADAEDNRVIASIAGGRKTMGALLYAAMSLLGKEGDRVTHVLVSEPFENCRSFFYPGQPVQALEARPYGQSPTSIQAADAAIELADIPFVPLRNKFEELNEPRRTFAGLVEAYSKAERQVLKHAPQVSLDIAKGILKVEGRSLKLTGRDLLIIAFLHDHAIKGGRHFRNKDEAADDLASFMDSWKKRHPFHQATTRLSGGMATVDDIPKALNSLRTQLRNKGLSGAVPWLAPERSRIGFDIANGSG